MATTILAVIMTTSPRRRAPFRGWVDSNPNYSRIIPIEGGTRVNRIDLPEKHDVAAEGMIGEISIRFCLGKWGGGRAVVVW